MYVDISRKNLLPSLKMVTGIIERRQTMPILANVLMRVETTGLHLTATDSELEIACTIPIESSLEGDGTTTLSAQKLFDICRSLGDENSIQIHQENEENRVIIKSGRSRFSLSTLPAEDFPESETIDEIFSFAMPQQQLKALFHKVQFAMAQQDVRYYLNGLLLELSPTYRHFVTTDGHRLALANQEAHHELDDLLQIIIPRKAVLECNKILDENSEEPVQIHIAAGHIRFELPNLVLTSKLIDGRFPDYQGVLPAQADNILEIPCALFKQVLSRIAILSNEKHKGVRLSLDHNQLNISAQNPEHGEAEEELDVSYDGEAFEVGFNVSYLLEALSVIDTEMVRLHFTNSNNGCLITPEDTMEIKYVVMPMRL
ncbi:DNA polymerase III subunit beta [Candidatus Venteria ishoeyi]|uniref:DNA polymerase III subunit beta n=1 Tax=Candidatus Venteria ishoeyi TaxID=1899563 RepID=UPI0025A56051|nr:DNA polymerase III subunit beta [Candidatus Venteria ishoeyi]MDM8547829.1 DNA polymerase III subunit beta [Candidatus Venteria ishoeyi]